MFIKGDTMKNKTTLLSLCIFAVATGLTACSNTKTNDNTVKPKTIRVYQESVKDKKLAKLSDTWEEQGVAIDVQAALALVGPDPKPVMLKPKKRIIKHYRKPAPRRVAKKNTVRRHVVKRRPARRIVKHVAKQQYRAPVRNIRVARLSGDYANNYQAKVFIDKMVSKHGFDRGYLNHLFSKTKATPFLQRMAFADAHPRRKTRKKTRAGRWTRYRGNFLTNRTINKGVEFARINRVALQKAEDRYGVPKEYILGIIGVETRYGGNVGKNRAIDALSAMGFDNARRGKYFRSELESYLLMTRKERLDPLKPMASYAGALGLCQFMPSNIKRYAVDHDRSGSVNLWTPADAIGSVANYFKKHGWKTGGTVAVKAQSSNTRYRTLKTGFKSRHSLSRLRSRGVSANYLGNITGKASLIKLNTYSGDELWLGGHNFYVITRYNHSSRYAMAVHQLAQAIKARTSGRSIIRQASL